MLIKIGSLEIRTGKDAKGSTPIHTNRDDIPQLGFQQPTIGAGLGLSKHVEPPRVDRVAPVQTGLALLQERKPHAITRAIQWPEIPESPLDQTYLSILVNGTDEFFRKCNKVDVCQIRDYVRREGIALYGDAKIAMDTLHDLHCVDLGQIHPQIVASIPELYNTIFRAAKGEFNVNDSWRV